MSNESRTTIINPMTQDEARQAVDQIKARLSDLRNLVYDLWTREGWRALGYESFRACAEAEFAQSWQYLYRLKDAAQVQRNLEAAAADDDDSEVIISASIPERHARELRSLPSPEAQYRAYSDAFQMAKAEGRERPTSHHVKRAVSKAASEQSVFSSPYHVITHMVTTGEITAATGRDMVDRLDRITAPRIQAELLRIISTHGLSTPELIPEIADMVARPPHKASYVLPEVNRGYLNGTPLRRASMGDLAQARYEARLQHIADANERKVQDGVRQPVIISGDRKDMSVMLKALQRELPEDKLKELAHMMASQFLAQPAS